MREKLIELLAKYFDIGDSYAYNLTRAKTAYAYGTVSLDDFEEFDDDTVADIADHLIANGVTVQKWIPVTEPPKERGRYLVTVKHWLDGKPVTREAKWNGADWLSCYGKAEITPRVTHWMPLPEPPKY